MHQEQETTTDLNVALAEMLTALSDQGEGEADHRDPAQAELAERVDDRLKTLGDAVLGEWPAVDELRRLPADQHASLVRQLGVYVERLSALRVELLSGRGPRLR